MRAPTLLLASALMLLPVAASAQQETPDEWVKLGARIHGGFGSFIPVGIRIGQDALQRLGAKPRDVTVTYYDSPKAPCACISDGIMIATMASPGQRTLTISSEPAPPDAMAAAVVRSKTTGKAIRYTVSADWMPRLAELNKTLDPCGRFDAVMKAESLFTAKAEN